MIMVSQLFVMEILTGVEYNACSCSHIHISTWSLFLIRAIWWDPYFAVRYFFLRSPTSARSSENATWRLLACELGTYMPDCILQQNTPNIIISEMSHYYKSDHIFVSTTSKVDQYPVFFRGTINIITTRNGTIETWWTSITSSTDISYKYFHNCHDFQRCTKGH